MFAIPERTLDTVQLADEIEGNLGVTWSIRRLRLVRLLECSARLGHTTGVDYSEGERDLGIRFIAVGEQDAAIALEQSPRHGTPPREGS